MTSGPSGQQKKQCSGTEIRKGILPDIQRHREGFPISCSRIPWPAKLSMLWLVIEYLTVFTVPINHQNIDKSALIERICCHQRPKCYQERYNSVHVNCSSPLPSCNDNRRKPFRMNLPWLKHLIPVQNVEVISITGTSNTHIRVILRWFLRKIGRGYNSGKQHYWLSQARSWGVDGWCVQLRLSSLAWYFFSSDTTQGLWSWWVLTSWTP